MFKLLAVHTHLLCILERGVLRWESALHLSHLSSAHRGKASEDTQERPIVLVPVHMAAQLLSASNT